MLENQNSNDDIGELGVVMTFTNNTKTYLQTPTNEQQNLMQHCGHFCFC